MRGIKMTIPEFKDHKLTGYPSWYKIDYPDNPDASFPLVGYITNKLPHPHEEWRGAYKKHVDKYERSVSPRVSFAVRVRRMSYVQVVRFIFIFALAWMALSAGAGYAVASFTVVPETAVSTPAPAGLRFRGDDAGECFQRFHMATGTYKKVCY